MENRVAFAIWTTELDWMSSHSVHHYLADGCVLAQLCNGLVELHLLQWKVLLVKPQQLLTLFVLVLQAWRPSVKKLPHSEPESCFMKLSDATVTLKQNYNTGPLRKRQKQAGGDEAKKNIKVVVVAHDLQYAIWRGPRCFELSRAVTCQASSQTKSWQTGGKRSGAGTLLRLRSQLMMAAAALPHPHQHMQHNERRNGVCTHAHTHIHTQ